jgi:antitoxin (DNA-binding transcriptional repressor) of toxin-antitoxin stability system
MAIVKMRELLRKPTEVFEQLERTREPVLLTRDGQAVAALFPVDPEQAEKIAMAALPEFVDSRARGENARSEGRTSSAAEFLADFQSRHSTGGTEPPLAPAKEAATAEAETVPAEGPAAEETRSELEFDIEHALAGHLTALFGETLSRDLASGVEDRIAAASKPVLDAAPGQATPASHEIVTKIQKLNGELFDGLLYRTLQRKAVDLASSLAEGEAHPLQGDATGAFGKRLAEDTLDAVTDQVRSFNCELIDSHFSHRKFSLPAYETCINAAKAFERIDFVKSPTRIDLKPLMQGHSIVYRDVPRSQ